MTDFPQLTEEELTTLNDLNYRAALAAWQDGETARLARLALLAPLDGFIDIPAVMAQIEAAEAGAIDLELRSRLLRVRTILDVDVRTILDQVAAAKTPAPMPQDPEAPPPA